MKPVTNDPAVALSRLQNLLADQPGKEKMSGTLYAEKAADGTVNLYRVNSETDTKLNRALHRFNTHSADARELVRAKIINVLQETGLEITADIRKALPSKTKLGNTAALRDAIANEKYKFDVAQRQAALQKHLPAGGAKEIATKLKPDLESMDWSSTASVGTIFRRNTDGTKALSAYLAGQFKDATDMCVANAIKAGSDSLKKTGSPDKAMVAAHEALLVSLKLVQFSPQFKEVVRELTSMVDTVAGEKTSSGARVPTKAGDPPGDLIAPNVINDVAKAAKEFVLTTVLLRTLSTELNDSLALGDRAFRREAETTTGHPPPAEFSLTRAQNYVLALLNKADKSKTLDGTGKADAQAALPDYMKFLADPARNNLNEFISLKLLEQEMLKNTAAT